MTVRFVPLDAMGEFPSGRLDAIVGWLEEAAVEIVAKLGADRVDVVVAPSVHLVPGWDCNGFAHGSGRITIGVSPSPRNETPQAPEERAPIRSVGRPLPAQLKAMLAHELHHAMRSRGPGYGGTLGEALVSEGLAQCFEEEVGCPTPNYALAVRGERLGLAAMRARKDWTSTAYDHGRWFYGDRTDPAWPWSGGYSLGYVLTKTYLASRSRSASSAVAVAADEVRREIAPLLEELALAATGVEAA